MAGTGDSGGLRGCEKPMAARVNNKKSVQPVRSDIYYNPPFKLDNISFFYLFNQNTADFSRLSSATSSLPDIIDDMGEFRL
jgi:hypothetical protein